MAPDEAALLPRWTLSRRELRDALRSGVVGRDRGDLLRVRWRDEGGSRIGVVEAMVRSVEVRSDPQKQERNQKRSKRQSGGLASVRGMWCGRMAALEIRTAA